MLMNPDKLFTVLMPLYVVTHGINLSVFVFNHIKTDAVNVLTLNSSRNVFDTSF